MRDEEINDILLVTFIGSIVVILLLCAVSIATPHPIQSTNDKETGQAGTYFAVDYKDGRYLVTAGHVIESNDEDLGTFMKFIQVSDRLKWKDVEILAYDEPLDIAILSCPEEILEHYTLSNHPEALRIEEDVTIISSVLGVGTDVYFDATIAGSEISLSPHWISVIPLSSQSGAGSSGSPVCFKGTNIVAGVLVGGYFDRDLTFMVPAYRVIEIIERINDGDL